MCAVVGSDEEDALSVNVRNRDDAGLKVRAELLSLDLAMEKMLSLKNERRLENKLL